MISAEPPKVDVWLADLEQLGCPESCESLLAEDELEKLRRFRFEHDARRYAGARAMLRIVVGQRLGISPARVKFAYGPWGKPYVSGYGSGGLHFNLSHSGSLVLLGVSTCEIGVDIEALRDDIDVQGVARIFMSAVECAHLQSLGDKERYSAFFAYWCCKEAYMKACGLGVSLTPTDFTVRLDGMTASLVPVPRHKKASGRWVFQRLSLSPDYEAAIVCDTGGAAFQIESRPFAQWPS